MNPKAPVALATNRLASRCCKLPVPFPWSMPRLNPEFLNTISLLLLTWQSATVLVPISEKLNWLLPVPPVILVCDKENIVAGAADQRVDALPGMDNDALRRDLMMFPPMLPKLVFVSVRLSKPAR